MNLLVFWCLTLQIYWINCQQIVPLWGKCGGFGYTGPTQCASGSLCFKQDQWYSQCAYQCPSGWECQLNNTQGIPKKMDCIGNSNFTLSSSKDWRLLNGVSPVKDQSGCNSCWAFAATSAIESQYLIKYKANISLSEQYLIDCSGFGDCSAGFPDIAFNFVIKNGIPTSSSYPYTGSKGTCKLDPSKSVANITEFEFIFNNEFKMQQAVDGIGPIVVFFNKNILDTYKRGSIINDPNCSKQTDHVGLAVGYGSENGVDYWIVKNSWGTNFGEGGYFRIARNKNMCGIGIKAMVPILYRLPEYCICDGSNYVGANKCDANLGCYRNNDYYSQCLKSCPDSWECNQNLFKNKTNSLGKVPLWGKCGGMGYDGLCADGSCYPQNIWYFQCRYDCPDGWLCQSNLGSSELKLWKENDKENYFLKMNSTTWAQINFTRILNYLSLSSQSNDTIVLLDSKTKIYYKLNSVDIRTGTSLTNLNTYFASGSWLLFYTQSSGSYTIWKQNNVNNYYLNLSPNNTLTWIQYTNGNNNLLDLIKNTPSTGETILYDSANDRYLKINSANMYSGKSLSAINTYEFDGTWTSFVPGFSLYGPTGLGNDSTLSTTSTIRPTTTSTIRTTSTTSTTTSTIRTTSTTSTTTSTIRTTSTTSTTTSTIRTTSTTSTTTSTIRTTSTTSTTTSTIRTTSTTSTTTTTIRPTTTSTIIPTTSTVRLTTSTTKVTVKIG